MARHAPLLRHGLVVVVLLAGACAPSGRDPAAQPTVNAGPAPATPVADSATVALVTSTATPALEATAAPAATGPRPPSPPATAVLRSAFALEPAGASSTAASRLRLTPGAEVVVDPAATFEVELSARSSDARLVLVDVRDDHVPATSTREIGAGTRLTLSPTSPLVPGSRYVLRLDGASDRDLHDDAGRPFSAVSLQLLAAGSPPPPDAKKQKAARKRRHR